MAIPVAAAPMLRVGAASEVVPAELDAGLEQVISEPLEVSAPEPSGAVALGVLVHDSGASAAIIARASRGSIDGRAFACDIRPFLRLKSRMAARPSLRSEKQMPPSALGSTVGKASTSVKERDRAMNGAGRHSRPRIVKPLGSPRRGNTHH